VNTAGYLAAIAVLLSAAIGIQVQRDDGWQPYVPATPVTWLKPGPWVERATLGYRALVADIYWMRTVVYFGRQRLQDTADKNYDLLYPFLDIVTALDPRFTVAYRFGAIFLSEPPPGGPGRPDLAIALLERGIERNPDRWEYPHDLAFVYYFTYADYEKAAEWFSRAADVPGAPIWLRTMAATTLERGGDRESARFLWREVHDSAETEAIRNVALVRLGQLDAFDQIDALNEAVWRYKARVGRFPVSWSELVSARILRGVPRDPTGVPYLLDRVNEDVRISRQSRLWPVPADLPWYGEQ
jgi:tetratricopeptide (TPR) repeat protein